MSPRTPLDAPRVGQILAGKYRIERLIGRGGMGAVYAAHHEVLDQRVAIKLLHEGIEDEASAAARFLNEARAAAQIPSEHVARVLDAGQLADGRPFLVMEHLEGCDLAQLLEARGELTIDEVVAYVLEAIEGLAHAHALGIVHRDLKPSNLFLANRPDGVRVVKVLDFGISKFVGALASRQIAVETQGLLGSPGYMAPEQVRSSRKVSPQSDVWALGVILYELLAGSLPFRGENVGEIFAAILEKTPTPLAVYRPDVPPGLADVVRRCLARDLDERYADVVALAEALAPFATKRAPSVGRIRTAMTALGTRPALAAARMRIGGGRSDDGGSDRRSPCRHAQLVERGGRCSRDEAARIEVDRADRGLGHRRRGGGDGRVGLAFSRRARDERRRARGGVERSRAGDDDRVSVGHARDGVIGAGGSHVTRCGRSRFIRDDRADAVASRALSFFCFFSFFSSFAPDIVVCISVIGRTRRDVAISVDAEAGEIARACTCGSAHTGAGP